MSITNILSKFVTLYKCKKSYVHFYVDNSANAKSATTNAHIHAQTDSQTDGLF